MNQEDIIRMANEANLPACHLTHPKALERFAKLVAEHEREACAKMCEEMDSISDYYGERVELICSEAIRARGQA